MTIDPRKTEVSAVERRIQAQFNPDNLVQFSSLALAPAEGDLVKDLILPEDARGALPMTKDKLVVSENPARVEWERQVRKFLKRLSQDFGHRITAPMIYEWATGISIKELQKQENVDLTDTAGGRHYGSANMHLRHINWILREYFGTPYKTKIAGRSVGRAYTVRRYFRVAHKKPACVTLLPEWYEGTLD